VAKSFHHRIARLVTGSYSPACQAAGCAAANGQAIAARFVCEWDQQQGKKTVARRKLYCAADAGSFAVHHDIYMAGLPDVRLEEIETAGRDGWRYSDNSNRPSSLVSRDSQSSVCSVSSVAKNSVAKESVQSVKSVSENESEER
jgi:hypothetical protein